MNTIVINGLRITTNCPFIKFNEANRYSIESSNRILTINFTKGSSSSSIKKSWIECVEDLPLVPTEYIRINQSITSINGLKVRRLTPHEMLFAQFIVDDIEEFVMDYDVSQCIILIPKRKPSIEKYVELLTRNPYLEIIDDSELSDLYNVYGIFIKNEGLNYNKKNDFVFSTKEMYERYLLSDVDVMHSFLLQLKSLLTGFGIELVKYPLQESVAVADRFIYRITDLGKQESHKNGFEVLRDETQKTSTIEFECSFLNNVIFEDFRHRYQNLDFLSNFTQFYTNDKLGKPWVSHVEWSTLPTDFTQDFSQDNQGNSAVSFQLNCILHYYSIYDRRYVNIREIILKLVSRAKNCDAEQLIRECTIESENVSNQETTDPIGDSMDWMELRK